VPKILCSISTRGRYFTTLPLALNAIISQTRPVDKLIIFDDNDEPKDMRNELVYSYFFKILDAKQIPWEWVFAGKKGQHHNHQMANLSDYPWVWRVDDDAIPESNVLENLSRHIADDVGAIGGSVLTPPADFAPLKSTGKIDAIDSEQNIQWAHIIQVKEVEHLHCTFLYRARTYDYNLGLSRVAHREETLFTYGLHQMGYRILAAPNAITWHMKNPQGGIRSETNPALYAHDEQIFRNHLDARGQTIVVLDCGRGDHIVFSHVLPKVSNPRVFTCYPDLVPGEPISKARELFGTIEPYNIYAKMFLWGWTGSLQSAFEKMYLP
jgi:hypothetical protein